MPDTVVFLSPDLKVLEATDDYLKTTMQTREGLIGKDFLEMFPDNPTEQESKNMLLLRESLLRAIQTKKPDYLPTIRYDIPIPASRGGGFEKRYWEAVHKPVLGDDGNVLYVIQKTSDVTQREVAKRAAELEESKYKFMMNALPQLIYTAAPDGKATFYNQRWYDYTGTSAETLEQHSWQESIHLEDLLRVEQIVEKAMQEGTEFQAEVRIKDKNGRYRWFLSRSIPMRDKHGNILLWIGSAVDIDATRQLVLELEQSHGQMVELSEQVQQAYAKAEAERKVLERLVMKAPVFFCILHGPEHRYRLLNEKYQQLMPNKELIGKTVAEALPEVAEQGFVKVLDEVYTTGKDFVAEGIPVMVDRYNTGKPEQMHLTFIYQAIYDENQKVTGIMVCGYDLAERSSTKNEE
ncbi:PAS domain-containing protein [Pontibacter mangrovi]|uniref:PAS domain-containing protein n=1 Tax=Pontibacter mangrovi TaxID=2589816 RepID=UPI001EF0D8EB|nr:PAS domain-containing protein [Pontibacter mangrovi]